MKHQPEVSLHRWILGLGAIAVWSGAAVLLAREGGTAGALAAGVLFTVPLCSLGEWLVHGVLYHGKVPGLEFIRTIHHAGHHFALFPPKRYVQLGPYEFMRFRRPYVPFQMSRSAVDNALTKWSQVGLHFVVGIPLILGPAWLLTGSGVFVASCLATLAGISWLLAHIHGVIHTPRDRWIERQGWFQWLDRHHYIHHVDLSSNVNFMLPICDVLLGTLKTRLSPEEAAANPSFEEAKPMAKDIPPAPAPPAVLHTP